MSHPKVKYVIDRMLALNLPEKLKHPPILTREGLVDILEFAIERINEPMGTIDMETFSNVEERIEAQAFAAIGTLSVWLDARFDVRFPEHHELDS